LQEPIGRVRLVDDDEIVALVPKTRKPPGDEGFILVLIGHSEYSLLPLKLDEAVARASKRLTPVLVLNIEK
jgi:hypothetical protein